MSDNPTEPREQPDEPGEVTWQILGWNPAKPFRGQLALTDGADVLAAMDLDPVAIRDLFEQLAVIHLAQSEALGIPLGLDETAPADGPDQDEDRAPVDNRADAEDPDEEDPVEDEAEGEEEEEEEEVVDTRNWWRRHPIRNTIVLIFWAVMLYGFIRGGLAV